MPSLTVENYLKALLQIALRTGERTVSTGQLAAALEVSPGTVTSMLKTLAETDPPHVEYTPYVGAALTETGRQVALTMLRRHRLIELFLVRTLALTWDQVHDEAEHMEHAVSDFLIDRIDEYLGHPPQDPHGDPIPTADGRMRGATRRTVPLGECTAGTRVRFVRVVNQQPDFLRFLADSGLELEATAEVVENSAEGGVVTVTLGDERTVSLARSAADDVHVERMGAVRGD